MGCVANVEKLLKLKYQEILETDNERGGKRCVYWLCSGAFSILITHTDRAEKMEGVASITS